LPGAAETTTVDNPIATYTYQFDGWTWEYSLFPDRVVARGGDGKRERERVIELAGYSDHPDWDRYRHPIEHPWVARSITGVVLLAAAIFLWPVIEQLPLQVIRLVVLLGLVGMGPVYYGTAHLVRSRCWVSRVTFKRRDGKDYFDVWQVNEEAGVEFEDFVDRVRHAIQSLG
jgi:hypothetical protein